MPDYVVTPARGLDTFAYDGYVQGSSTTYATASAVATAHAADDEVPTILVGQQYALSTYYIRRGLVWFDASSIPAGETIVSVALSLVTYSTDDSTTDFDLGIYPLAADPPIDADTRQALYDAVRAASLGALWRNTSGIAVSTRYASAALNPATVSRVGLTCYGLMSDRELDEVVPTGKEYLRVYNGDAADEANWPQLRVTTTLPVTQKFWGKWYWWNQ